MAHQHTEWMSKKDAAEYLGVSERQIERLAAQGKVRTKREARLPHQTTAPVLSNREDLEAARAGTPNYYPVVEVTPAAAGTAVAMAKVPKALKAPEAKPAVPLDLLVQKLLGASSQPSWLSVEEAVVASGLPEDTIRELAPLWARRGDAIQCGVGLQRRHWRIRRAALDAPLPPPSA